MKKIPCVFKRDFSTKGKPTLLPEFSNDCDWVARGEGQAYRKWDGSAAMRKDGGLYKRYDCKKGKNAPDGFVPCSEPDPVTGHWPGWIACDRTKPDDRYFWEAFDRGELTEEDIKDGTYELIGPKVNGNPECFESHFLMNHYKEPLNLSSPISFESIKAFLNSYRCEGLVFHHPDGRMAKIRRNDFGFSWPVKND